MIRVHIFYPPSSRFDMAYYCERHMPMVQARIGAACSLGQNVFVGNDVQIERGVLTEDGTLATTLLTITAMANGAGHDIARRAGVDSFSHGVAPQRAYLFTSALASSSIAVRRWRSAANWSSLHAASRSGHAKPRGTSFCSIVRTA